MEFDAPSSIASRKAEGEDEIAILNFHVWLYMHRQIEYGSLLEVAGILGFDLPKDAETFIKNVHKE